MRQAVRSVLHRSKPSAFKTWKLRGKYGRFTPKQPGSDRQVCLTARQAGGFLPLSDVLLDVVPSQHCLNKIRKFLLKALQPFIWRFLTCWSNSYTSICQSFTGRLPFSAMRSHVSMITNVWCYIEYGYTNLSIQYLVNTIELEHQKFGAGCAEMREEVNVPPPKFLHCERMV